MRNIKLSRNAEMITQLCQSKNTPPPPSLDQQRNKYRDNPLLRKMKMSQINPLNNKVN